jgi:glycosyltransferase involved in cell wall biosynthesis
MLQKMANVVVVGPNIRTSGGIGTLYTYATEYFSENLSVTFLDSRGKAKLPIITLFRLPLVFIQVTKLLILKRVSIFHINFSSGLSFVRKILIARFLMTFGNVPITFQYHGSLFHLEFTKLPKSIQKLIIKTLNQSCGILVFGELWKSILTSLGVNNKKITVMTMGVPDFAMQKTPPKNEEYKSLQREVQDYKYILFCGDVTTQKGIDVLIMGISETNNKKFRLIVLGNGDYAKWREFATSHNVDAVFCGRVSSEVVKSILPMVDYFILPSMNENMPVSLLEAASAKVPVITTDVGSTSEYFDRVSVSFLTTSSPINIANALNLLETDTVLRKQMVETAKDVWCIHFDSELTTENLESFWLSKC